MSPPLVIIDDDDDLREILSSILVASGYTVVAFADARQALTELEGGLSPFLILLDLMMPGMSGWEFREQQAKSQTLASIPVVVVTAATSLVDAGRTLPSVEAVRKPFTIDALLKVVRRYQPDSARAG